MVYLFTFFPAVYCEQVVYCEKECIVKLIYVVILGKFKYASWGVQEDYEQVMEQSKGYLGDPSNIYGLRSMCVR